MKTSEYKTATRRVNAMSRKISDKPRKTEKRVKTPPQTPALCYKREDIEGILTGILLVSVGVAAVLLTLSMFIAVVKH